MTPTERTQAWRKANRERYLAYQREYQRRRRAAGLNADAEREYRTRNPEKVAARMALNNAVRDGKLERLPCEVCGAPSEAHHEDYSKPLEVRWLCPQHHREIHHHPLDSGGTLDETPETEE